MSPPCGRRARAGWGRPCCGRRPRSCGRSCSGRRASRRRQDRLPARARPRPAATSGIRRVVIASGMLPRAASSEGRCDDCRLRLPRLRQAVRRRPAALAVRVRRPARSDAGPGFAPRRDCRGRGFAMALWRGIGARRPAARLARRGLDPARAPPLARDRHPFQARIADADGFVQGPWRGGDDQSPARNRRRPDPRRLLGERRRLARDLRSGQWSALPHLCPGGSTPRQAGADRGGGCGCPRCRRHAAGRDRRGTRRR